MEDIKWCVKQGISWRRTNNDCHNKPCIREEQAGVLASMNHMWWRRASGCSIRVIKLTSKNHLSLSVNLYWIKKWSDLDINSENWSYKVKFSKSQSWRVNTKVRSNVTTLIKSKRNKMARINMVQAQVEEVIFIFNLEYRLPLYQEGYHMDCQQSLNTHIA
jgi:hypothetical protein